ncbi:hypothetical protein CANARDRAFT_176539 [[Candida] arabinofermentans NRRL YB-2248]|uniref:Uncharacterized protein n=1 Tax=[Candida] arabinofermentans NRRL YB-2248 TaxID=983967 RepID=A0A1E4SYY5_9ASCO|nr:hypothetical protein CANARDRAFT_176539 [[Candida] arabinofermentans NRRL YB-2248]
MIITGIISLTLLWIGLLNLSLYIHRYDIHVSLRARTILSTKKAFSQTLFIPMKTYST